MFSGGPRDQKNNTGPVSDELAVFRPTHKANAVTMKRFPHQQLGDFQLNNFAEKIPIHFRSSRKVGGPPGQGNEYGTHSASSATPSLEEDELGAQGHGRETRLGSAHAHAASKPHKNAPFLPGDRVIFAESPSAPGVPVVYRTPDERASNPDRLNLDRRKLTVCPILEGEEQLRLLNYQHNQIGRIQHLSALKRLIFLDLYDNHIEEISGLAALKSLRVLMLGKNSLLAETTMSRSKNSTGNSSTSPRSLSLLQKKKRNEHDMTLLENNCPITKSCCGIKILV